MIIEIKSFSTEEKENMISCYKIRNRIFVEEQGVDKTLEFDGLDDHAVHYLLSEDGKDVATARWIEKPEGVKIERFAVLKEYRNKAYGTLLLKYILVELVLSKKPIFLHSQESAVKFYSVNGFDIEGDDFKEAGIIHKKMVFTNSSKN